MHHAVLEMVTAASATLVAGLSLMLPNGFHWDSNTSVLQLDMLTASQPRATAAGAVMALLVAVFATTVNRASAAWGSALCGAAIVLAAHLLAEGGELGIAPTTLNYLDSIGGGVLLGGIAVAVLRGRWQVFGWTLGGLAAVVFGQLGSTSAGGMHDGAATAPGWARSTLPPLWLILITLVLVCIGTIVDRNRDTVERRSVEVPVAPILAGLVFVVVVLSCSSWLDGHTRSPGHIVTAAAATVAATAAAAFLLPRRDGVLILLAVALSSVGAALVPARLPLWSMAPLVALIAAGLFAGLRRPAPMFAIALPAVMALYCALAVHHRALDGVEAAALAAALAAVGGYCFGSAAPRYNPTRVLGIAIIFVPSMVTTLRQHLGRAQLVADPGHWYLSPTSPVNSTAPYWAALGIAVGCAAVLPVLRQRRPPVSHSIADDSETLE